MALDLKKKNWQKKKCVVIDASVLSIKFCLQKKEKIEQHAKHCDIEEEKEEKKEELYSSHSGKMCIIKAAKKKAARSIIIRISALRRLQFLI